MHLVGFSMDMYYGARPYERQICIAIHFQKCNVPYFPNAVFTYLQKCCPVSEDIFFASSLYSVLFLPTIVSLVERISKIYCGLIHTRRSVTLMAEHRLTAGEKSCWRNCVRERNWKLKKKPHDEAIVNFYFVRNVNRAMKSGRVGWVRYVACMVRKPREKETMCKICLCL